MLSSSAMLGCTRDQVWEEESTRKCLDLRPSQPEPGTPRASPAILNHLCLRGTLILECERRFFLDVLFVVLSFASQDKGLSIFGETRHTQHHNINNFVSRFVL